MLKTLRRILQEVNTTPNFSEALCVLTSRVREAIDTQACSLFLLNETRSHYVMLATDGLNPKTVGKLKIPLNEGLIGLVGQRQEPLNIENASTHPNYYHHPLLGENQFKAFLGVPIIYHRQLLGVLAVNQKGQRSFDEEEEAFLVTVSTQLANIIAQAESSGKLTRLWQTLKGKKKQHPRQSLRGIAAVAGVGIGRAIVIYPIAVLDDVADKESDDINADVLRFQEALAATREDMNQLREQLPTTLARGEKALFDAYLTILDDQELSDAIVSRIRDNNWAPGALRQVFQKHIQHFENMENDYLRERANDLRDLGQRILAHLQTQTPKTIEYPEDTILVGEEITASELVAVPSQCLRGIVSLRGSKNSHVAILARAMNIPVVVGITGLDMANLDQQKMIVDGYYGHVYTAPPARLHKAYRALAQEEKDLDANLTQLRDQPAETLDGHSVSLLVNAGLYEDAGLSLAVGADGVGLFRTEVPFLSRDAFPTEEEQRVIYRQLLNAFNPRTVTMRTLDIGGDKSLPYFPVDELNPFLGWRGIRITLDHPELFSQQLRAMLRANEGFNNLKIMYPMICQTSEIDEANKLLHKAHQELLEEGLDVTLPPVGVMIEVPATIYQIRAIAKRVDFLSVGSNDLTQYLLAVDRSNHRVANLYDGLHPAILRALQNIVELAHEVETPVSICGELSSDPLAVILLMAIGFDSLSLNAATLPRIKWVIRNFTLKDAKTLLKQALQRETPTAVRQLLAEALEARNLGGLIRAGK